MTSLVGTVQEIVLDAEGVRLSALLSMPDDRPPTGVIVALHGTGMRAGYFHAGAVPGQSLLDLGAELGWSVLAVDRPGYGLSAAEFPDGRSVAAQAEILCAGLRDFDSRYPVGAGFGLVAHSFGSKVALAVIDRRAGAGLIGLDASGCGLRFAVDPAEFLAHPKWQSVLNWGLLRDYPPKTFQLSAALVAPTPAVEVGEALTWLSQFSDIAGRVGIPVRFTFAERERWWCHGEEAVAELTGLFPADIARVDRQSSAGHNISLGWTARAYHLRVLAFMEECLLMKGR
ncbi:alpha/beta hydrolase [Nocardia noduli]|uniref:alpha/beta hydrolase n=1 Tax=Nocardia noduli TaxID=2815722 RepID=UPI001C214C47|nr:alpha/beta hydrolase [Nocardia noduli]